MAAAASSGVAQVDRPADDDPEFDLPVDALAHRGQHQVILWAHEGVGELGEQRRVLRQLPPGLQDVRPVVQPDANHLRRKMAKDLGQRGDGGGPR